MIQIANRKSSITPPGFDAAFGKRLSLGLTLAFTAGAAASALLIDLLACAGVFA
jgi:hypothetical protein